MFLARIPAFLLTPLLVFAALTPYASAQNNSYVALADALSFPGEIRATTPPRSLDLTDYNKVKPLIVSNYREMKFVSLPETEHWGVVLEKRVAGAFSTIHITPVADLLETSIRRKAARRARSNLPR